MEDTVNKAYRHINAPLRNRIFHSPEELNDAVAGLVEKYNQKRLTNIGMRLVRLPRNQHHCC